jgi:hypothetical protein
VILQEGELTDSTSLTIVRPTGTPAAADAALLRLTSASGSVNESSAPTLVAWP